MTNPKILGDVPAALQKSASENGVEIDNSLFVELENCSGHQGVREASGDSAKVPRKQAPRTIQFRLVKP